MKATTASFVQPDRLKRARRNVLVGWRDESLGELSNVERLSHPLLV
jgi:hypothetical protein